jgi:hypothetical protein
MTEKPPPSCGSGPNNNGPVITDLLNQEQIQLLARLIMEVLDETGYGDVKIIIAEKRVVRLKAEKSY